MNKTLLLLSAGFTALVISSATPALAQDTPPPATEAAPEASDSGGDIIITATRRASPLANIPIAVTAITAQALQNSGATDIRQLNQLAPSLLVSSTGSESNGSARIRGVGTVGDNPGLESSVAVFIDGVYRSRTGAGLNELGEVQRVEVLRGPQGTLFGRNASAGLLNIVSKAPEFNFGAKGEVTYGNYDYWRVSGRVTGPVTDKLALALDGVWAKRDGFLNLVDKTGKKVGDTNDRDRYFLRGQALFEPNSDLSVRLIADYTHRDEHCCGAVYLETREKVGSSPSSWTVNPVNRVVAIMQAVGGYYPNGADPYAQNPYLRNTGITPGREYVSKLKDWGVSGELNYNLGDAKLTSITAYRNYKSQDSGDVDYNAADIFIRDPNSFRQFRTFTQELRLQGSLFEDRLDWLIGGYYAHEKLTLRDNIRFGADYGRFMTCRMLGGTGNASSLPVSLFSNCGTAAGTAVLIGLAQANLNAGLTPAVGAPTAAAISGALGTGLTAIANIPSGTGDTDSRYFQKSENWALFTHNIFKVTDSIDVTVGVRYTHEAKDFRASLNNNNATCPVLQASTLPTIAQTAALGTAATLAGGILTFGCLGNGSTALNGLNLKDSLSDGEFSGTGVISFRPARDLMVYASYSKGYKAGGYNLDRFELGNTGIAPFVGSVPYFFPRTNADAPTLRFAAEKVDAYEIGLKLNQRHWGANIALFRQDFSNFQLNTFNGFSFVVQNINGCSSGLTASGTCANTKAGLRSQGAEVELNFSPARNVRGTMGVTYARTKYAGSLVGSADGTQPLDPALFLLPGNTNSNAPKYVGTASLAWTPDIGSSGLSALFYIDTRMTSDYNTGSDLFVEKIQDGYFLVNARIGLRGPDQRWAIEFWGQNIFNQKYTQVAFNSPLQGSNPANSTIAQLGRGTTTMANQNFSAYLAEPRTYGITLRGQF